MRYLIDTHTAIWYIQGDNRLSDNVRKIIDTPTNQINFSIVTLWEIVIKINIGKLELTKDYTFFRSLLEQVGFSKLELDERYFESYLKLPLVHRDPFDRMLIAQAISENMPIISADTKFDLYSEIERIW
jgi:PIN domain nuclease of toxin-antitoxin system